MSTVKNETARMMQPSLRPLTGRVIIDSPVSSGRALSRLFRRWTQQPKDV